MADEKKTIIRTPRGADRPYFSMARSTAQDGKRNPGGLSFDARGLLCYLLSKPDDWTVEPADIRAEGGIGRDAANNLLKELRDAGYLETEMLSDEAGKFAGKIDRIYETSRGRRDTEKPHDGQTVSRKNRNIHNRDSIQSTESLQKRTGTAKRGAGPTPAPRKSYAEMHPELSAEELQRISDEYMKLGPGQTPPNNEVIAVISVRTGDYPVYDAIEAEVFSVPYDENRARNWQGREGGIAKWLTGDIRKWGKKSLGHLPAVATAEDVREFIEWYKLPPKKPFIETLRNPATFSEYWRQWWAGRTAPIVSAGSHETQAATRPVNYEEIREYQRLKAIHAEAVRAGKNPDPLPPAPRPVFE